VVTYEQQLLRDADSLFREGNYEYAKVKFDKIRTLKPSSQAARTAQYYLGYINVYYENPFASWEAALREFKLFVSLYPDDARVDEINSWIKLLVVMQSFKKEFLGTTNRYEELKQQKDATETITPKVSTANIDGLTESLRNCYHVRDSLNQKSKDLENFILDLEKECQETGK
jgi:outer membrane protein assembly factor BamD (BamD/ComL family)